MQVERIHRLFFKNPQPVDKKQETQAFLSYPQK